MKRKSKLSELKEKGKNTFFTFSNSLLQLNVVSPIIYICLFLLECLQLLVIPLKEIGEKLTPSGTKDAIQQISDRLNFSSLLYQSYSYSEFQFLQYCLWGFYVLFIFLLVIGLKISSTNKNTKLGIFERLVLKVIGFAFIIFKHMGVVFLIAISLYTFKCDDGEFTFQCFKQYPYFLLSNIVFIILTLCFVLYTTQFLTDSIPDSQIPWSSPDFKVEIIFTLLKIIIVIDIVLKPLQDEIIHFIILIGLFTILIRRMLFAPMFNSLIFRIIIGIEWIYVSSYIICIISNLRGHSISINYLVLILLLSVFGFLLWFQLYKKKRQNLLNYILLTKKEKDFENLIYKLLEIFKRQDTHDQEENEEDILVQGAFTRHFSYCQKEDCVTRFGGGNEDMVLEKRKLNRIEETEFEDYLTSNLTCTQQNEMVEEEKEEKESVNEENHELEEGAKLLPTQKASILARDRKGSMIVEVTSHTHAHIDGDGENNERVRRRQINYELIQPADYSTTKIKFLIFIIKKILDDGMELFPNSVRLRLLCSYVNFSFLNLAEKALFDLSRASIINVGLISQFEIYRYKKKIEKSYSEFKNYDFTSQINVKDVIKFEKKFYKFRVYLEDAAYSCSNLWQEMKSYEFNFNNTERLGGVISKIFRKISQLFLKLQFMNANHSASYKFYAPFLRNIMNNDFAAEEVFLKFKALIGQKGLKMSDKEGKIFSKDDEFSVLEISASYFNFGKIGRANHIIQKQLGYTPDELVGKDLNKILPSLVADHHDDLIKDHITKGTTGFVDKSILLYPCHKKGYMVPLIMLIKMHTNENAEPLFICLMKKPRFIKLGSQQEIYPLSYLNILLTDEFGEIKGMSKRLEKDLCLPISLFLNNQLMKKEKGFNIQIFNEDILSEKSQQSLKLGASLIINTEHIASLIDVDDLSQQELKKFKKMPRQLEVFIRCETFEYLDQKCKFLVYQIMLSANIEKYFFTKRKVLNQELEKRLEEKAQKEAEEEILEDADCHSVASSVQSADQLENKQIFQIEELKKGYITNAPKTSRIVLVTLRSLIVVYIILIILGSTNLLVGIIKRNDFNNYLPQLESSFALFAFQGRIKLRVRELSNIAHEIEPNSIPTEPDRFGFLVENLAIDIEDFRVKLKILFNDEFTRILPESMKALKEDKIMLTFISQSSTIYERESFINIGLQKFVNNINEIIHLLPEEIKGSYRFNTFYDDSTITYRTIAEKFLFYILENGDNVLQDAADKICLTFQENLEDLTRSNRTIFLGVTTASIVILAISVILMIILIIKVQQKGVKVILFFSEMPKTLVRDLHLQTQYFLQFLEKVGSDAELSGESDESDDEGELEGKFDGMGEKETKKGKADKPTKHGNADLLRLEDLKAHNKFVGKPDKSKKKINEEIKGENENDSSTLHLNLEKAEDEEAGDGEKPEKMETAQQNNENRKKIQELKRKLKNKTLAKRLKSIISMMLMSLLIGSYFIISYVLIIGYFESGDESLSYLSTINKRRPTLYNLLHSLREDYLLNGYLYPGQLPKNKLTKDWLDEYEQLERVYDKILADKHPTLAHGQHELDQLNTQEYCDVVFSQDYDKLSACQLIGAGSLANGLKTGMYALQTSIRIFNQQFLAALEEERDNDFQYLFFQNADFLDYLIMMDVYINPGLDLTKKIAYTCTYDYLDILFLYFELAFGLFICFLTLVILVSVTYGISKLKQSIWVITGMMNMIPISYVCEVQDAKNVYDSLL